MHLVQNAQRLGVLQHVDDRPVTAAKVACPAALAIASVPGLAETRPGPIVQPGLDTATGSIVLSADFNDLRVAAEAEIGLFASGTRPSGEGDDVQRDDVVVACRFKRIGHQCLSLVQEPAVSTSSAVRWACSGLM
jgi:hypothetical protein